MKKLNVTVYNKLLLQAQEAREQGMIRLADAIEDAIGNEPAFEKMEYSYGQMNEDIHKDLWKLATKLMIYYDLDSIPVELLDRSIISWAAILTDDIEKTLEVSDVVKGPLESKLPGEQ